VSSLRPLGKSIHLEVRPHSPEVGSSVVKEQERRPQQAVVQTTREMDQAVVCVQRGAQRGCRQKTVAGEEDCLRHG
jgi:hypothetical protein